MKYIATILFFAFFTECYTRTIPESEHVKELIREYYTDRIIYSPSRYVQTSVEYSERIDDKYKTDIEKKVKEFEKLSVFNRTLRFEQSDDDFECESFTDSMGNLSYFRFRTEYDNGIKLKYETQNNGSVEETSIHFRELLVNDTLYDLRKMIMFTNCTANKCTIKPEYDLFELVVEFNSYLFNVSFNNTVKTVFPTDVKFSVNFNTTHDTNYTFYVKIENDEDNISKSLNNTQDDDGYYFARNNSRTYTSFDRYALCDNKTIPVHMSNDNGMTTFSIHGTNNSYVNWDPMIGGTFEQLAIKIDSYLPTSGSSASQLIANIAFVIASIFITKYVF